ncbi:unnamed protein product [Blumeria hordei]|uniref:Uncharacterized protein n=2 Tax=Blumeria hordei TaxID=2867405 RepID=A0A383V2G0_BLUHO|nr:hypothetical protein BGHDH14_bghG006237000001001 [Blumeria hordei DH14]SZF06327.1 unnamed protein product [Blumeria hordei]
MSNLELKVLGLQSFELLVLDKYQIVPWDPTSRVQVDLTTTEEGMEIGANPESKYADISLNDIISYAMFNVKKIFGFDLAADRVMNMTEDFRKNTFVRNK